MSVLLNWLSQPWPWYVSGPMIGLVMIGILFLGKSMGVSSNFRTLCSIGGGGKFASFFDFNWKSQIWNLIFLLGTVVGGAIAAVFLSDPNPPLISELTQIALADYGIASGETLVPSEIFSWENLWNFRSLITLVGGGFLVGFGARYAGGCTSGHAISGLSNLQLPSLVAVIGFFIGGLISVFVLMPILF